MTDDTQPQLIATCAGGLEEVLAAELSELGITATAKANGIVRFVGDRTLLARANRNLRTASRVLVSVTYGSVRSADDLYTLAAAAPWDRLIPVSATIAVAVTGSIQSGEDARFLALRVKDAVVDRQRRRSGRRSSVDRDNPTVSIVVHVSGDKAEISVDSSGVPLHERGYRRSAGPAPLRETLAAGLIRLAGWDQSRPFFDPFCGSGTIAIEAALMAAGRAPGDLGRSYAFEGWPAGLELLFGVDTESRSPRATSKTAPRKLSQSGAILVKKSQANRRRPDQPPERRFQVPESGPDSPSEPRTPPESPPLIFATDVDKRAISAARTNAERAGVAAMITFTTGDFRTFRPGHLLNGAGKENGLILTNPPYGQRLEVSDIQELYRSIGLWLKEQFRGWDAWILSGNPEATKAIGLQSRSKCRVFNGGLESRLLHFPVFPT